LAPEVVLVMAQYQILSSRIIETRQSSSIIQTG